MQVKRVVQLSVSIVLASAFLCAALIGLASSDIHAASGARPSADCSPPIVLGSNLIANGDAEADVGATDKVSPPVQPSCWTVEGNLTVVSYTTPGSPTTTFGLNYFAGGPNTSASTATQTIDVSSLASLIDSGVVSITLSAWLGGFENQTDDMTVLAILQSQTSEKLDEISIDNVTPQARDNATVLLPRSGARSNVAIGTRKIVIKMVAIGHDGVYNDGYADDLSLILGTNRIFLPLIRR